MKQNDEQGAQLCFSLVNGAIAHAGGSLEAANTFRVKNVLEHIEGGDQGFAKTSTKEILCRHSHFY